MHWIFCVKFVDLGDSCMVGGDPAMNIIIVQVPVLNASEYSYILIRVIYTHIIDFKVCKFSLLYLVTSYIK